jgi:hypothetical protein
VKKIRAAAFVARPIIVPLSERSLDPRLGAGGFKYLSRKLLDRSGFDTRVSGDTNALFRHTSALLIAANLKVGRAPSANSPKLIVRAEGASGRD